MKRLLLAALVVAAAAPLAGTASAYCDPKYWPLCTNDCQQQRPTVKELLTDPVAALVRACPE